MPGKQWLPTAGGLESPDQGGLSNDRKANLAMPVTDHAGGQWTQVLSSGPQTLYCRETAEPQKTQLSPVTEG